MKLFVAIPVTGPVCIPFLGSMLALVNHQPCHLDIRINHGSGLMLSRNMLCSQFLEGDCDKLLFIDGDIAFDPGDVERIISHDVDVVGGFYAKKMDTPQPEWVCAAHENPVTHGDGLQECDYVGTGFMCLTRDMLETVRGRHPELSFGKGLFDWWSLGLWQEANSRTYLTEDYFFCKRWQSLGGKIYADTNCVVRHVGEAVFPLRHQRAA
jgi:hypothetical protein